jgi:anthranilate/para-aminobenzoate synthase component II
MSDKIIIIDFEDSFTYNIANILFHYEKEIIVVSHKIFFSKLCKSLLSSDKRHAVILGPGPGHPDQYKDYYQDIKKNLLAKNIYTMGICLGHQILGKISGHQVERLLDPVHGQAVECEFEGRKILVQKYNSLGVFVNKELKDVLKYPRGISYQFHPESIGTSENELFFKELLAFVR